MCLRLVDAACAEAITQAAVQEVADAAADGQAATLSQASPQVRRASNHWIQLHPRILQSVLHNQDGGHLRQQCPTAAQHSRSGTAAELVDCATVHRSGQGLG